MPDQINAQQAVDNVPGLGDMSKDQLLAYAESLGVKVKPSMNKQEIIQAIEAGAEADQPVAAPDADSQIPDDPHPAPAAPDPPGSEEKSGADSARIGTIRVEGGIERVKVGPGEWVPTVRDEIVSDEPVTLYSRARAGKTVFGMTGRPIVFDEAGKAVVSAVDGLYLKDLPNYSLVDD